MKNADLNRRRFLQQSSLAGGLLLLDNTLGFSSLTASAAQVRVRKDIDTLTAAEITALRKGVRVMQGRPSSNPTSWLFQANIHGHPSGPGNPAWDKCQHGSFFFLAWHRMYIHFFERILRAASGSPSLTLPYWNYSKPVPVGGPNPRALPVPFRPATVGTPPLPNPLFVLQRAPGINSGTSVLPGSVVTTGVAMGTTNFTSPTGSGSNFGGQTVATPIHFNSPHGRLESTPHDDVHVQIGGATGWMRDPNMAARDPIFWLHHANVDRLWNQWLAMGGGRVNPVTSASWRTPTFTFFTETGASVSMSACQILNSATQLGYRYDTDGAPVGGVCPAVAGGETLAQKKTLATKEGTVELGDKPIKVDVELGTEAKASFNSAAAGDKTYILTIEGLEYTKAPGVHFEVYLNLPAAASGEPDAEGPNYIGNLSFFALQPHDGGHASHEPIVKSYDITEVVKKLRAQHLWNEDRLSVSFVARGLDNANGTRQKPKVAYKPKFKRLVLNVE